MLVNSKNIPKIVLAAILAYIFIFGGTTLLRHYTFQTQTWDMATFVQTLWNTLHGKIMINYIEEIPNTLGVHFSPILFLLLPGFAVFPSPYFFLIIQAIAVALGAWPLYKLSGKILEPHPQAKAFGALLAIGYLLYPGLHWSNFYDFHPVIFLPPLMLWGFERLLAKKYLAAGIILTLAAATREDAILAVLALGVFGIIEFWKQAGDRKFHLGLAAVMVVYLIIATKIIIPALGGGLLRFDRYENLGKTPSEAVVNVVKNPLLLANTLINKDKAIYLFWLFLPVMGLPILYPRSLILLGPGLLENMLTDNRWHYSGIYHYDTVLVASIFIASIYGLKRALEWRWNYKIVTAVLTLAIITGYFFRSPLNPLHFPFELFKENKHWTAMRNILKIIPANVSVSANTHMVPHLSTRPYAFMLGQEHFQTDIVIIDSADLHGFKDAADLESYVDSYMNTGNYNLIVIDERYLLLTKKSQN